MIQFHWPPWPPGADRVILTSQLTLATQQYFSAQVLKNAFKKFPPEEIYFSDAQKLALAEFVRKEGSTSEYPGCLSSSRRQFDASPVLTVAFQDPH